MWLWENAEKIGNLAQVLTLVTAIIAVVFAYRQIYTARRSQQEATAKELYQDYLQLAFKHPKYAVPEAGDKNIIKTDQYRWFVAVLLNSCDEILACVPRDDDWKRIIAAELEYHEPYLTSPYFLNPDEDRGWTLYSKELKEVFEKHAVLLRPAK
jgi:hypothetical protein